MKRFLIFILLLLLILNLEANAQDETSVEDTYVELWADLTLIKNFKPKWSYGGDLGYRTTLGNNIYRLLYVRPHIEYQLRPHLSILGGIGSFNTLGSEISNTYEIRIFQDLNISGPTLKWASFFHRIRLEQRFFMYQSDELDNDFNIRGRYMIGFRTNQFSIFGGEKDYRASVSFEPFFPLGEEVVEIFANSTRFTVGLAYLVSEQFRIELDIIAQRSKVFAEEDFNSAEYIIRFRLIQKL